MGKLIVNEQDVKRILGEETNGENGLISQYINKELSATATKVQLDMHDMERKYDNQNKEINDTIAALIERISNLEKQRDESLDTTLSDVEAMQLPKTQDNDILDIRSLCRELKFSGLDVTKVKFFLYRKGIYDIKINEFRDSYFLKSSFGDDTDKELLSFIHTNGKKVTFSKDIVEYFHKNNDEVVESIASYEAKKNQYKTSRKNVAAKQIKNYRDEIKNICGTDSPARWIEIYKEFSKSFPTFYEDHKKYAEKYAEEHPNAKYEFPKLGYVVEVMQQGNVLLKIACHLYVN